MIFLEKKFSFAEYRGLVEARNSGQCTDADRQDGGRFGDGNDCGATNGGGQDVAVAAKKAKERNVDVMLGGGKRVAVMDEEARQRAIDDFKENPKPEGSAPGSTTDLWDREFIRRAKGRVQKPKDGSPPYVSDGKIASTDDVFTPEDLRQNDQFVAHESVALYLSNRHEEERRKTGASGPGSIIDTAATEMPEQQIAYLADSLTEDAIHAYDVLGVDPGFYSTDLESTMRQMTTRHPEFESDENSRFIFTTLLAITSSGQGPDANLRDADDLYRMFKEHGTVVPSDYGGGARDVTTSLKVFQGLLDSFGKDRTRRLLSGYAPAGTIEKTLERLAGKSKVDEWRAKTGSAPWSMPVDKQGKKKTMTSGELRDEVVPVAAIFGPKIGSFFANLSGRHEFLTMDRWLMRSVGRVSGELITRSTPESAKKRAEAALTALEGRSWSKAFLFGVDKSHGITKADLIRSLKIQQRTGVIEENGAAFIWATAAERSHQKVKRPSGGGYGEHPDPAVHSMHQAGNSLFKSLILEQQDPKTDRARRNIREVFRRVQDEVERRTGRRADIDEIQAALWQYEKRLWKHLGAKTNITENSLFSAAAEGVISGRIKREKPFQPASRRDADGGVDDFDNSSFDAEQAAWESNFDELGVDMIDVLKALEEDVEERANFAALDFEQRDAACIRQPGGRFGEGNKCQADGDGVAAPEKQDDSWKEQTGTVSWSSSELAEKPPIRGGDKLRSLKIEGAGELASAMSTLGVDSLDSIVAIGGGKTRGAAVRVAPYSDTEVFVTASIPIDPASDVADPDEGYVTTNTMLSRDRNGETVLNYVSLSTPMSVSGSPNANQKDRLRVASLLSEQFVESLSAAESAGVSSALMQAAGDSTDVFVQGYRLWPQFGFDAPVPLRELSKVPDEIVLKAAGVPIPPAGSTRIPQETVLRGLRARVKNLTIQQLISTREGERWWDKNGSDVTLTLDLKDKNSLGYRRFQESKKRLARLKERNKSRAFFEDAESREADCGRDEGGRFGNDNDCQAGAGTATAKPDESWKASGRDKAWDSRRLKKSSPIKGGEAMASVKFEGPKQIAKTMSEILPGRATIDDVATIGGGAVRAGEMTISSEKNSGEIKVELLMPVSPDKPDEWKVYSGVSVLDNGDGGFFVNYDLLDVWPPGDGAESVLNTDSPDDAMTSRISSIMMERMLDSLMTAERLGATAAETVAVGTGDELDKFKGYRLWPQFGFDGEINSTTSSRIEEDVDSVGLSDDARAKWDAGEPLNVQDIVSTREGRLWWDANGTSTGMSIDFSKKDSAGYRQYQKMQRLLPRLRERNKSRDWVGWIDDLESRDADCGRDEGGRFGAGNECAGYRGSHKAPQADGYAKSADSLAGIYPDDVYSDDAGRLYGHGDKSLDDESARVVRRLKGKPDEPVRIFRAVPEIADDAISPGDWVTINKQYAKQHGESTLGGNYKIVSAVVPARHIFNDGNSIHEWGYDPKPKKEGRAADCGRDEGGRFGPRNQCQEEGDSQPAASVRVSGDVSKSLDTLKIDQSDVVRIAGAEGGSVFMRPAPDMATSFSGASMPVLVSWEKPLGGIDYGLSGSSAVGTNSDGEPVLYHSTITVEPGAADTPAKKHAAARAFYEVMAKSLEEARNSGFSEVRFNAAGSKSDKSWKGYTIWPRMGFDAPIPGDIREKLPDSLSHAKSLLDLHATREGTEWWANNGREVDISFRLGDPGSPQAKIMARWLKKFGTSRRDMPLGAGDGWLSPADLARFDELWEEIWDEGDLDEYEWEDGKA
jgi:hypothetical protein